MLRSGTSLSNWNETGRPDPSWVFALEPKRDREVWDFVRETVGLTALPDTPAKRLEECELPAGGLPAELLETLRAATADDDELKWPCGQPVDDGRDLGVSSGWTDGTKPCAYKSAQFNILE